MLETSSSVLRPALTGTERFAPSLANTRLAKVASLSAEERVALQDCPAFRRTLRTAVDVVRQGERTNNVHFLVDGWACRFKTTRDGRRQISAVFLPGDICNLGTVTFQQNDNGIRMLSAGSVLSVPVEHVASLAAAYAGVARSVTCCMSADNAILSEWALCLGRMSARERLAHLLCELAFRLGFTGSAGSVSFDMPLTQEQLGDTLGLTSVHINRTLQNLLADGLLETTRRTITVPDIAALRRAGEFAPTYLHDPALHDNVQAAAEGR